MARLKFIREFFFLECHIYIYVSEKSDDYDDDREDEREMRVSVGSFVKRYCDVGA